MLLGMPTLFTFKGTCRCLQSWAFAWCSVNRFVPARCVCRLVKAKDCFLGQFPCGLLVFLSPTGNHDMAAAADGTSGLQLCDTACHVNCDVDVHACTPRCILCCITQPCMRRPAPVAGILWHRDVADAHWSMYSGSLSINRMHGAHDRFAEFYVFATLRPERNVCRQDIAARSAQG